MAGKITWVSIVPPPTDDPSEEDDLLPDEDLPGEPIPEDLLTFFEEVEEQEVEIRLTSPTGGSPLIARLTEGPYGDTLALECADEGVVTALLRDAFGAPVDATTLEEGLLEFSPGAWARAATIECFIGREPVKSELRLRGVAPAGPAHRVPWALEGDPLPPGLSLSAWVGVDPDEDPYAEVVFFLETGAFQVEVSLLDSSEDTLHTESFFLIGPGARRLSVRVALPRLAGIWLAVAPTAVSQFRLGTWGIHHVEENES